MSRRTRTMIPTHRRLLLPQAVGPDQVAKALKLRQNISKRNYDKQSKDLPPLEVGDKVRNRPNREQEWRKAEVLPRSYLLEDDQGVFTEEIGDRSSQFQMISPCTHRCVIL